MNNKNVGTAIATLRNSKGMTQAELGERVGVSFQAVSKWERGEALPDVALLPTLADVLETTIDYILRYGETKLSFRGKISVSDLIDGLNHLKQMGEKLGTDHFIYRCAINGINQAMNTDIEPAFTDDYVFEAFVAEAVIQKLTEGMYVDMTDVARSFKHEHFREIVLNYAKKYSIV